MFTPTIRRFNDSEKRVRLESLTYKSPHATDGSSLANRAPAGQQSADRLRVVSALEFIEVLPAAKSVWTASALRIASPADTAGHRWLFESQHRASELVALHVSQDHVARTGRGADVALRGHRGRRGSQLPADRKQSVRRTGSRSWIEWRTVLVLVATQRSEARFHSAARTAGPGTGAFPDAVPT